MRVKTWKVLDWGRVPKTARTITYTCPRCGRDAELPVQGRAIAQAWEGIFFDSGDYAMPAEIQCRKCLRIFTTEPDLVR